MHFVVTTIPTTAVILQCNIIEKQPDEFVRFVDTLLTTIARTNISADAVIRTTACQCLEEIETCHPGVLTRKLAHIMLMVSEEKLYCTQAYVSLFTTSLDNAISIVSMH